MCVVELDRPWLETPFLFQGFTISSSADIDAVRKYCQYVYIDPDRSQKTPQPNKPAPESKGGLFKLFQRSAAPEPSVPVEQERKQACELYPKQSALVRNFMDEIRLGRAIDVKILEQGVDDTVESILRNPNAMLWLAQMRQKTAALEQHAMNTCILAIAFGRYLGLPKEELKKLGLCALVHDFGMVKVPDAIVRKAGTLTEAEKQEMQKHTEYGRDLLMTVKDLYFGAVDVAHTHHEWFNGKGYPRGLDSSQLSPFTRIISVVDAYDDMMTEHSYAPARTAYEALKAIHEGRGSQFDEGLTRYFVEMIGVFPVGSLVELNTGEIAIVISTDRQQPMRPKLIRVRDYRRQSCREEIIELSALDSDKIKIVRILRNGDYGLDAVALHNRALNAELP